MKVLILCTGNSCRSQMTEGYLRQFGGEEVRVFSAGIEAHGLNPKAVEVMAEDGIDISHQTSNKVEEFRNLPLDFVITVCDNALEKCPVFPANVRSFHHSFPDPANVVGSEEEVLYRFTEVREMIKVFCQNFIRQYVTSN